MSSFTIPSAYELIRETYLPDINSEALLLYHIKSGARVQVMPNADRNKVFFIAFRTPPEDSTGVAHIIEHTVLCGSEAFPAKDPFMALAKGDLSTFINAMTYPDKTIYPVASLNDTGFRNLMHVYLDAVFHPNIYHNRHIFEQEGWHYEPDEGEGGEEESAAGKSFPLKINGVVYNEMRGVMSSPDDVMDSRVFSSLFPDTPYRHESGGDPGAIPDLTYEAYLEFHRRYYHPSNSYIFLYGDADMEERLDFLDREYLSDYERTDPGSEIPLQSAFSEPVRVTEKYSVLPEDETENKAWLSYNLVIPGEMDEETDVAVRLIDYALCDAQGAPLKERVVKAGLGMDVSSLYENGSVRQPFWSFVARYTNGDREEEFITLVEDTLRKIAEEGFEDEALLAAIGSHEFRYREADFGSYPRGLIYGLSSMDSWLYDDDNPWKKLNDAPIYGVMRQRIGTGYFEEILRKFFIDNPHKSFVRLIPEKGLQEKRDAELAEKVRAFAGALDERERTEIREEYEDLLRWQNTEDSPEALNSIPLLTVEDISPEPQPFFNVEAKAAGKTLLVHPVFTGGIVYITMLFDIDSLTEEMYRLLVLYKAVFGVMDTENYTYAALNRKVSILTGGVNAVTSVRGSYARPEEYHSYLEISVKVLKENVPEAFRLLEEILFRTRFDDRERLRELIAEEYSAMRSDMVSAGHVTASMRAQSYISEPALRAELLGGLEAYRKIKEMVSFSDGEMDQTSGKLKELNRVLFTDKSLKLVDVTSPMEDMAGVTPYVEQFIYRLPEAEPSGDPIRVKPAVKNEGLVTAGQVQYVCAAGDFRKAGYTLDGTYRVLRAVMGYDYLYNMVRVQGGAYGCMGGMNADGTANFVSYRDPHLKRTLECFKSVPDYLRTFDADDKEMGQYILGAAGGLDQPMTPAMQGKYGLSCYLGDRTMEMIRKERSEALKCTAADIRALEGPARAFLDDGIICVVGSEEKIREAENLFLTVESLL